MLAPSAKIGMIDGVSVYVKSIGNGYGNECLEEVDCESVPVSREFRKKIRGRGETRRCEGEMENIGE